MARQFTRDNRGRYHDQATGAFVSRETVERSQRAVRAYEHARRSEAARRGWETRRATDEHARRSEAARRGWETRRATEETRLAKAASEAVQRAIEFLRIPPIEQIIESLPEIFRPAPEIPPIPEIPPSIEIPPIEPLQPLPVAFDLSPPAEDREVLGPDLQSRERDLGQDIVDSGATTAQVVFRIDVTDPETHRIVEHEEIYDWEFEDADDFWSGYWTAFRESYGKYGKDGVSISIESVQGF